ncbi:MULTISPECIES: menaquinol-cytochrome c reductase cytochrome b/c subunit [Paenibacillus]|uniref:C-type cytochrome n=1 Tax=Paenibacillus alvei TaxID=44250 RepID=A0ABT4EE23_PAEAL|nr:MULTISPECIES: menaquinol-cytochrome c reductase cytochrome b/c subunit [Paenibacillus]EPY12398.1 cytochrome C class I [Paenibacillus alvei A6-6i-x]MCY9530601.1 c-type cytochrome [Paenibacillus alvei]
MAHGNSKEEKVVFVGDSRVKKRTTTIKQPDYTSFPGKSEAFIPNFLLKEWMVGCVALVAFLVLTISEAAPLGYPANPNNSAFVPIPDWYFLFLYQFLKYPYASGSYVVIGTVLVPGLAFGGLLLAPFLDTGKERRFYRRPIASSMMILTLIACVYLTRVAWVHYEAEMAEKNMIPEHVEREEKAREAAEKGEASNQPKPSKGIAIVEKDDPAFANMKKVGCLSCHAVDMKGAAGPALVGIGDKLSKDEILTVIKDGKGGMPSMVEAAKKEGLNDQDIEHIADWLSKQKAAKQ